MLVDSGAKSSSETGDKQPSPPIRTLGTVSTAPTPTGTATSAPGGRKLTPSPAPSTHISDDGDHRPAASSLDLPTLAEGESANCAKSIVTLAGVENASAEYVVPKVLLPWPEWIQQ
jgi:hypothetical protein